MDTAEFADAEAITVFLQKIVLCKGQTRGYFRNFCIFTAEIFCVIPPNQPVMGQSGVLCKDTKYL